MNTTVVIGDRSEESIEKVESLEGPKVFLTPRIHAVAINATEMLESQTQIKDFLTEKVASILSEENMTRESLDVAVANGWKKDAFERAVRKLEISRLYYSKLLSAVEAGYTIVPNMPCDQFAIRVNRNTTRVRPRIDTWHMRQERMSIPEEKEDGNLSEGAGRYESPRQLVTRDYSEFTTEKGTNQVISSCTPVDFDAIEFPFAAAVPVVMNATQAAMSLRLFDRIGIVPQSVRPDQDPIILGQIVRREGGRERVVSFLIAWHLDFRTL